MIDGGGRNLLPPRLLGWSLGLAVTLLACGQGKVQSGMSSELVDRLDCVDLQAGQTKMIYARDTGSGIPARYLLRRLPTKPGAPARFEAALNLRFSAGDELSREQLKQFKRRLRACYDAASAYLKGPDGEELRLRLTDREESRLSSPIQIQLKPRVARENSGTWSVNSPCPSLLHESLHHLGLVDEYVVEVVSEGAKTEPLLHHCRATGKRGSIMKDSFAAWNLTSPLWIHRSCSCPPIDPMAADETNTENASQAAKRLACLSQLKELTGAPEACPSESRSDHFGVYHDLSTRAETEYGDHFAKIQQEIGSGRLTSEDRYEYLVQKQNPQGSLLMPAQFRAITRPACEDRNGVYYACARHAYVKDPIPMSKVGTEEAGACPSDRPPQCRDGQFEWLD